MIDYLKKHIKQSENSYITYDEFISKALYDPEFGYYMKEKEKVGRQGDFITSSNISDVFGKLFAQVFLKLIEQEKVKPYICEIGGGNGRFAHAVLTECKKLSPTITKKLTYCMIESSPYHLSLQKSILPATSVEFFQSLDEMRKQYRSFNGIIFSNELYDAFPVKVIEKRNNGLYEVMVGLNAGELLEEKTVPLTNSHIIRYLNEQQIDLSNGQRFEVPLAMVGHIEKMAGWVDKGIVFTIDYGYTHKEWMLPEHKKGSLRGYYQHNLQTDPLIHPGEMDLTTHIHFDSLIYYGDKAGLNFINKLRQDHFLLGVGILDYLQDHHDPNPFSEVSKQNRALRSLIMDGSMSAAFHVIIQQKNVSVDWRSIIKNR
ncbi:SAM-dependent methyltransferase [Cytobacillus sp. S13-E01]|uniref:class I SAM-dependent methyltransferase n=1 Tax=Cytobacillus sp. S13-E01 TaxID=3031326 RepID=UPI0023D86F2C|nr:SAM-dependent methyltransferase [Cytobacillus sp. S13-E01]MDF0727796.1 SAM-dependent methyltransferase [Cytobacillus sp. S13-E01]